MDTSALTQPPGKPWWKRALLAVLRAGPPVPRLVRPLIRGAYRAGVAWQEGWPILLKWVWIEPVMRSVCAQMGRGFRAERLPYMRGHGRLRLGDDVRLSGRSCFYFMRVADGDPEIRIGHGVFIGNGCTLAAAERIVIGDRCLLAPGVRIHDNDGHPLDAARRAAGGAMEPANIGPVTVEAGAWLAAGAVVLKGVTVGARSVVGAGAVVTEDVPPDCVVAGNPARVVRRLTPA
jgi:acetyltransferase-like isoleucine patch superfamily enzyme